MGEHLWAYLEDVYAVAKTERTRDIYDALAPALDDDDCAQLLAGRTRVWNRGGVCTQDLGDLGEDVWGRGGRKVLGTPVAFDEFVKRHVDERLAQERQLWDAPPEVRRPA